MFSITQLPELNVFISTRFRDFTKDKTPETLISLENLAKRSQISANILWECALALKIEPQKRNEQIYFTSRNSKQLEQLIKRIEISWAYPNILAACCRPTKLVSCETFGSRCCDSQKKSNFF